MSDKPTSKARFWETLQQRSPVPNEAPYLEPMAGLSDLGERILKILYSVQAATVFELQTRLGVEPDSEIEDAVQELEQRRIVTTSTRGRDVVVSLRG
jgi:hypothetical protein